MNVTGNLERLLVGVHWQKASIYLGAGLLLVVAIVWAGEDVSHHIDAIESWIAQLGPWGLLAFIGLYVVATSLLFPESVLSIIAGAMFGLSLGLAAVIAGNLLAAVLQYGLSRRLLHDRIQNWLDTKPALAAIQLAMRRDELKLQFLVRMTPLNPASVSYMLGASSVKFAGFLLASLGFFPHLLIEVYFGYAGKHVARIAGGRLPGETLHDVAVFGGLMIAVIVMIILSRAAHKVVSAAISEVDEKAAGGRM